MKRRRYLTRKLMAKLEQAFRQGLVDVNFRCHNVVVLRLSKDLIGMSWSTIGAPLTFWGEVTTEALFAWPQGPEAFMRFRGQLEGKRARYLASKWDLVGDMAHRGLWRASEV